MAGRVALQPEEVEDLRSHPVGGFQKLKEMADAFQHDSSESGWEQSLHALGDLKADATVFRAVQVQGRCRDGLDADLRLERVERCALRGWIEGGTVVAESGAEDARNGKGLANASEIPRRIGLARGPIAPERLDQGVVVHGNSASARIVWKKNMYQERRCCFAFVTSAAGIAGP
jgi:hypothetical protein